jgi:hypothetical protein
VTFPVLPLQDGQLLIHDLHQPQQAAQAARLCSKADCPAALTYHPLKPHLLLAAAGPTLHVLDTRQLSGEDPGIHPIHGISTINSCSVL